MNLKLYSLDAKIANIRFVDFQVVKFSNKFFFIMQNFTFSRSWNFLFKRSAECSLYRYSGYKAYVILIVYTRN